MPTVDMPLERLRTYQGINPKPDDFETYWDTALQEMRAVDPATNLEPAEFQTNYADCRHLTFTGVGGARIYAKLAGPRGASDPHPAVLKFHGYTGNSGSWADLLPYAAMGCTIAALDCRGQGGRSEDVGGVEGNTQRGHIIRGLDDSPEKLLYRQIFLDTAQLAGIVMDMDDVDETRAGAFGGSQGGALTLACAALEPRIKRAAPVFPLMCLRMLLIRSLRTKRALNRSKPLPKRLTKNLKHSIQISKIHPKNWLTPSPATGSPGPKPLRLPSAPSSLPHY